MNKELKNSSTKLSLFQRRFNILELLHTKKVLQINELAKHYKVSQRTLYEDIESLVELGLLNRGRGIISSNVKLNFWGRMKEASDEKLEIARYVINNQLIKDDIIIFFGTGTTVYRLGQALLDGKKKNIRIITNNLLLIEELVQQQGNIEGIKTILLGGDLCEDYAATVGIIPTELLKSYQINLAILGVVGVSREDGIWVLDQKELSIQKIAIENAAQILILATHSKIGRRIGIAYKPDEWDNKKFRIITAGKFCTPEEKDNFEEQKKKLGNMLIDIE